MPKLRPDREWLQRMNRSAARLVRSDPITYSSNAPFGVRNVSALARSRSNATPMALKKAPCFTACASSIGFILRTASFMSGRSHGLHHEAPK